MIVVKCNKNEYAYDVHSLVKAFYPAEDVKVFEEGEKSLSSDTSLPELFIYFEEKRIEAVKKMYLLGNYHVRNIKMH